MRIRYNGWIEKEHYAKRIRSIPFLPFLPPFFAPQRPAPTSLLHDPPFAAIVHPMGGEEGDPRKEKSAEKVDRTPDLMIFSHTLSQLSYLGCCSCSPPSPDNALVSLFTWSARIASFQECSYSNEFKQLNHSNSLKQTQQHPHSSFTTT